MPLTRRAMAWLELPSLPFRFLNISRAVEWLQSENLGYHYQTMWRDVSTRFQIEAKGELQRALGPSEYIPQKLFIEKDWKRPESYYYYGTANFRDPATGELYGRDYSIYSDTSLTDRELEETIYGKEEERIEEYGPEWEFYSFETVEAFHKWGAPRSQGYGIAEI